MPLNRTSPVQTANTNSNVEYSNLAEGEHEGRLVYVADLGLQERSYMGDEKPPAQQVSLGIEIIGETVTIDGKEQPRLMWTKPFNIFYQMNELGNEYKYYKVFDQSAQEGQVADWDSALGKPCNVIVKHQVAKDGKVYDNIDSITPIPSKYQDAVGAATITDQAVGDAEDENNPATKALFGLAKFVYDKRITGSANVTPMPSKTEELDDNIPF